MAEPWEERVVEALIAKLEEIKGANGSQPSASGYWYTPNAVERTRKIEGQGLLTDDAIFQTVYVLAPVSVEIVESNGQEIEKTMVIDFLLARRHLQSDEPFHQTTPIPWTVQNRLWHDFQKKILEDVQLGDLVTNIGFQEVLLDGANTGVPKWAIVIGQILPTHRLPIADL
jgi:hypothetical protein